MSRNARRESARLQAHISPDSIYCPPKRRSSDHGDEYYIFFITGNPGLIAYYHTFLAYLSNLLNEDQDISDGFHIYGHSLGGFESEADKETRGTPYGLQQQIDYVETTLENYVRAQNIVPKIQQALNTSSNRPLKVILIGHSVGGYILLEILRRHRKKLSLGKGTDMEIVGGVLLFPTITHIAESRSGLKLGWLLRLPYFGLVLGALVRLLTFLVPRGVLCSLVKLATGFPADAAETTTAFIKSPTGVRQALHMARDEMKEITEDAWDEEIWGASVQDSVLARAKLIFYFGERDPWVADRTRDDLIRARAFRADQPDEWKPRMIIDEDGIPHGFCIKHSELVAQKVQRFVKDIIVIVPGRIWLPAAATHRSYKGPPSFS